VTDRDGAARETARSPESDLSRQLRRAREQSAASQEILLALARAGEDPEALLDTVVARALDLLHAQVSQLYLVDGDRFRLSRLHGEVSEAFRRYVVDHPVHLDRTSLLGRVAQDRRVQQIADVLDDPTYGRLDLQELGGFRTLMSAPMVLDDAVVGMLSVWRTDVDPFDAQEQAALMSVAAQAAIVLRQVDLRRALEAKVAQLESLGEVGDAIASSLDLDEVLSRVVEHAVLMTGTDGGSVMEYDEEDESFAVRAAYGSGPRLLEALRGIRIRADATLVGRAAIDKQPLQVADLGGRELDDHLRILYGDGWRSVLAVPILRDDRVLGALVVRRRSPGPFPGELVDLLETLASQSALAIVNARLFRELQTKTAELEVASRHKSEFLASMSHELRTPLNAVIGFSEVLLDRLFGDLNERQEEYLHDIRDSGRHLLELLNEILDLSKVEAGQMTLEPTEFDVASALDYTSSLVRERAAAHAVTVSLDVADDVGTVETDELRFKQVVLNLLSNAVKFTPDDGHVALACARDGDEVRVTVTDDGVGIPPEDHARIFESFQQGGRGAPKEEGTGLGLTLCRRLVGLFGGRLWMESEVGVGSTFGFSIPAPRRDLPRSGAPHADDRPVVLLVDDDRASLDLVAAYLEDTAVQLLRALDGEQALALVAHAVPAAVVLDIRLPHRNGWEVLADLKADPRTADVPVVVATIVDERPRGLSLGAAEYLLKPIRRDDLVGALRRVGVLGPAPGPVEVP
jgi:signal transduction histidine kinase